MQVDIRNVGAADYFSVVQLPVDFFLDGLVHQSFDLTHGLSGEWFGGGRSFPLPHVANIGPNGPSRRDQWTATRLSHTGQVW